MYFELNVSNVENVDYCRRLFCSPFLLFDTILGVVTRHSDDGIPKAKSSNDYISNPISCFSLELKVTQAAKKTI